MTSYRTTPARILIVEDDPMIVRALKRALKALDVDPAIGGLEGVHVHATPSLEGALILLPHGWDLVITDLEVEGGTTDGVLVNEVGGSRWPVRVIVHSGAEVPDRLRRIAWAVFAKPTDPKALVEAARRALSPGLREPPCDSTDRIGRRRRT